MNVNEIMVIASIKIFMAMNVTLLSVSALVYFERKIAGWVQSRRGPNRVGPYGILQPFADVFKLVLKEDIVPTAADKPLHLLAPMVAMFVAFTTYAVIPIGPIVSLFGYTTPLAIADVEIGVLFVLALTSLGVYGITLSGWSSGSKYSLLGGVRSSAQMISYEISMGFSIAGVLLLSESLRPYDIIAAQSGWHWNVILQPIGFITFFVSAFAETNRLPFDLPEAEQELVGGFHTEYSSFKFAGFFLAEYAMMIISAMLITTLYLGGYQIPYLDRLAAPEWLAAVLQVGAFLFKTGVILFVIVWVRWTLPRFRYDQLMNLGWKVMFPLSLINLVWAAILAMWFNS
jgi:NADH-quinone oxidoreductase subunit H